MKCREGEFLFDAMERYMDENEPGAILLLVVELYEEKARHIQENWQDDELAGQWAEVALRLDRLLSNIDFPGGPCFRRIG